MQNQRITQMLAVIMTLGGLMLFGCSKGNNAASPVGRSITEEQFNNRMILRNAMLRYGFKALDSEWRHFTLKNEPFPETYFTFPVKELN